VLFHIILTVQISFEILKRNLIQAPKKQSADFAFKAAVNVENFLKYSWKADKSIQDVKKHVLSFFAESRKFELSKVELSPQRHSCNLYLVLFDYAFSKSCVFSLDSCPDCDNDNE